MLSAGYNVFGGRAGSAVVTYNQHTIADEFQIAAYATDGFIVDLSQTYASLNSLRLMVKSTSSAIVRASHLQITLNSPSAGKAKVKMVQSFFDKVTSIGNVTGQPSGVSVVTTSSQDTGSESAHTHAIDHDHGSFTSGNNNAAGGQVLLDALGPNLEIHTHSLDLPSLTGTSGAGSAHNHKDNSIYDHRHNLTFTATNLTSTEVPNATSLSGTVWNLLATGIKL